MSINFEMLDLRAFLALFDRANFHQAAESLNCSQPAFSRRIKALEARLGAALFERSTRRVRPTVTACKLEPIARRLLDELDSSIQSISGIERQHGQVTIASIPSAAIYFLPRIIKRFNARYSRVRLRVLDRAPQEGLECVMRGEVDFGINMVGSIETDVTFTHLLDDPYVLAVHRNHDLAKKKRLMWRDLAGHPLIRIGRANSGNRALLDGALAKASVQLEWPYEVSNLTTAYSFVESGLGASILPRLATPHRRHPLVVIRSIHSPDVKRAVGIIERRQSHLSPAAKFFREMLLSDWSIAANIGRTDDARG